jgi:hypothetical protein
MLLAQLFSVATELFIVCTSEYICFHLFIDQRRGLAREDQTCELDDGEAGRRDQIRQVRGKL